MGPMHKLGKTKKCTVDGCDGTMELYREMTEASERTADAPFVGPDETAKFWVCRKNDDHREIPTEAGLDSREQTASVRR